jgi:hypothetical protein
MILEKDLVDLKDISEYNLETKRLISEIKTEMEEKINKLKEERNALLYIEKEQKIKEKIEISAKEEFKETKKKKLLGGIGIRESKKYKYDKDKAFNWAKEHSLCLQLDNKAFNSLIKTQDLDFVKTVPSISVTYPSEIKL